MKILKLSALMLAAVLLLGFGTTTLSAEANAVKSEKFTLKMDGKVCNSQSNCKCQKCDCTKDDKSNCTCEKCECGSKASAKKGPNVPGKCGAGKCGAGKCG